ncbi:MAG TPA: energy transducer TonB [Candidatus Sulfotelmatobacter sp.]|jgi:protein TonB
MQKQFVLILVLALTCIPGTLAVGQSQQTQSGRKLIRRVDPQYPQLARNMNLGGTVKVVAVVASDGSVKKVEPVGGSPILVQAAENAVTQWKFAPGAESRETVELHFTP